MGDLSKGFTFSGNSPNNAVTAPNLNNLVDMATVNPSLISAKPVKTSPQSGDQLLIWDAGTSTLQKVSVQALVPQTAARTGYSGLNIINQGGTSASQLVISASEIVLVSAGSIPFRVTSFSATLNIGTVGANGLESTALQSTLAGSGNHWLYIWAISDGTSTSSLASASATSPTLPPGNIYSVLLSAWYYNPSKNLIIGEVIQKTAIMQMGSAGSSGPNSSFSNPYISGGAELSNATVNSTSKTFTGIDLSRCVPPGICASVQGIIGQSTGSSAVFSWAMLPISNGTDKMDATSITNNRGMVIGNSFSPVTATSFFGFLNAATFSCPIDIANGAQQIFLAVDSAAAHFAMRITGYTLL